MIIIMIMKTMKIIFIIKLNIKKLINNLKENNRFGIIIKTLRNIIVYPICSRHRKICLYPISLFSPQSL